MAWDLGFNKGYEFVPRVAHEDDTTSFPTGLKSHQFSLDDKGKAVTGNGHGMTRNWTPAEIGLTTLGGALAFGTIGAVAESYIHADEVKQQGEGNADLGQGLYGGIGGYPFG